MPLRIATVSLGCNKNQVDTEVMLGYLQQAGFAMTELPEEAEILLVNTCGFIQSAVEESIQNILELATYKKNGKCLALIVTGCMVQRYKDELQKEIPEIDAVLGTGDFTKIVEVVQRVLGGERVHWQPSSPQFLYDEQTPRVLTTPSYSAYVKIADGCNNCCSYCTIPLIRGNFRSRRIESVVKEVQRLAKQGVKEINLIAQDVTSFGLDNYKEHKLSDLLNELVKIDKIEWLRLLYAYPTEITDDLIEIIAREDKICNYLDLPLQHISDRILQKMGRQGSKKDVYSLLRRLRKEVPGLALRTSLIVGFPGETEEEFQELEQLVSEVKFEHLGVFKYSREEGTVAASLPHQVAEEIKEERYHRLMSLQQGISLEKNQAKIGKILKVLVEGHNADNPNILMGRSKQDAPEVDGTVFIIKGKAAVGDIIDVRVTSALEYDLLGEVVQDEFSQ